MIGLRLSRRLAPVFCAALLAAAPAGAAEREPDDVNGLIAQARGEIARLRDALVAAENALSVEEARIEGAIQRGDREEDVLRRIEERRRRLALDRRALKLTGACEDAFDRLDSLVDVERATRCVEQDDVTADLVGQIDCGKLALRADRGQGVSVTGYVGEEAALAEIEGRFGPAAIASVEIKPWPICEALDTLTIPMNSDDRPKIAMLSRKSRIRYGESLAFQVTSPSFPAFLYLAYLQADGSVVNLTPRLGPIREQMRPNARLRFGDGRNGRRTFTASAPPGPEAIVAVAARSPIQELEALEIARDGQYWQGRPGGALIDRGRYLEILNESLKDRGAKNRGVDNSGESARRGKVRGLVRSFSRKPAGADREVSADVAYITIEAR